MLKRTTAVCVVIGLLMPILSSSASASSVLWVSTSDHTDLIKDEEHAAAPVLMMAVPGLDDDASGSMECADGLEILYEEPVPEELAGVDEVVQPEPISVEEVVPPETVGMEDEAEMAGVDSDIEKIKNEQIQIP